ncbi:hypothetical protein vBEcoMWL3_gp216 [Escherichia phage vB_EcoM_WL-3]|nr:hypothetical protein vBEcoMWL3_gp216 [Escherichia phage vB_EcoM_WL-3]
MITPLTESPPYRILLAVSNCIPVTIPSFFLVYLYSSRSS